MRRLVNLVKSKAGFGAVEIMVILVVVIILVMAFRNHIIPMLKIIFSQL